MSATAFACPECRTVLRPTNPVPDGKKVKCPKCGNVFVPPSNKPKPKSPIQEKSRAPTPPQRRQQPEEDGWELVEDEAPPAPRSTPRESIPGAQLDQDIPEAELDQAEEDDRPRRNRPTKARRRDEDDFADEEGQVDQEEDRPRRKKSRKGKRTGVNTLVKLYVILGGITLLLLIGGGGFAAWLYVNWDRNRGSGKEDPLAYIPADSALIYGTDVTSLLNQPALAAYAEQIGKPPGTNHFWAEWQKQAGLEFKDLCEHLTGGTKPPPRGGVGGGTVTLILKTKAPIDQNKIRKCATNATAQRFKGKTYFKINEAIYTTLFMPSDRMIILTNVAEPEVQAMVSSDGIQSHLPAEAVAIARQAETSQLWAVFAFGPSVRQEIERGLAQGGPMVPAEWKGMGEALARSKAAGAWGTLEGNVVKFNAQLACADQASAQQLASGLKGVWDRELKGPQVQIGLAMFPLFGAFVKELTQSTQFSNQGPTVQASAQVNFQTLETLVKEVQKQGPRAFPGFGPPGGGGPGRGQRGPGGG